MSSALPLLSAGRASRVAPSAATSLLTEVRVVEARVSFGAEPRRRRFRGLQCFCLPNCDVERPSSASNWKSERWSKPGLSERPTSAGPSTIFSREDNLGYDVSDCLSDAGGSFKFVEQECLLLAEQSCEAYLERQERRKDRQALLDAAKLEALVEVNAAVRLAENARDAYLERQRRRSEREYIMADETDENAQWVDGECKRVVRGCVSIGSTRAPVRVPRKLQPGVV